MTDRAPLPCPEMGEVRQKIDDLDRKLVALLAERQKLIAEAGKVKPSRDTVRDEARIEEVVRLVLAEADRAGLAADIAEPVWRQLIEASIAYELKVFDGRD